MLEKGTSCDTMQERRAATGSKLDDQSFNSPAARALFHVPEFRARWSLSSQRPSVNLRNSTRGVCAGIDDRENISQAKRQKPVAGSAKSACSRSSMGLTEMVDMPFDNDIDEEVNSPDLVAVGQYQVKPSSKPILDRIFRKHGDIAASYVMLSSESRSLVLDEICEIIQSFEAKTFPELGRCEVQRVVDRARDWERAGLKVGWLLEGLEGILEAYQVLRQARVMKEERDADSEAVKTMKIEQQELEQKLILVNQRLKDAEAKRGRIKERISEVKGKIRPYLRSPLLEGLL